MNYSPIFIVGVARSGTTLLSMILNAHSLIAISPETHYFDEFCPKYKRDRCFSSEASFKVFVEKFLGSVHVRTFNFTTDELGNLTRQIVYRKQRSHRNILESMLSFYAYKHNKKIWGEKTSPYVNFIKLILDAFPNARIIQVIRDPRDVILSTQKVPWGIKNMANQLTYWKKSVTISEHFKCLHKHNYLEIRYEDILASPEDTVRKVCLFLQVPFEPGMLQYYKIGERIFDPKREWWKIKNLQPIDPKNRDKWKTRMIRQEQRFVMALAGTTLLAKGYEGTETISSMREIRLLARLCLEGFFIKIKRYLRELIKGKR